MKPVRDSLVTMFRIFFLLGLAAVQAAPRPGLLVEAFVFETAPFPSCHAATILKLPSGDYH